MISFDISKFCLPMIIWIFFRLQMIFLDMKNAICPMPSAPEVFSISIWGVTCNKNQISIILLARFIGTIFDSLSFTDLNVINDKTIKKLHSHM